MLVDFEMSMFVGLVCRFLLNVLHFMFSFYLHLNLLKLIFLKFMYNVGRLLIGRKRKFLLDSELIVKSVKSFSKIPKHLTFALGDECISYDDLVQIIVWTLYSGIPVLSFYDHNNELNVDKLFNAFNQRYPQLKQRVNWEVSFSKNHLQEVDCKASPQCLRVNVFTAQHGRQLLIDSIKELCQSEETTLTNRAATETALDEIMSSKLSFCSNPDFMVINGNVYTTYGLSPWHLTFTEFLTIPSYKLLRTADYLQILATFANCEQKFGR